MTWIEQRGLESTEYIFCSKHILLALYNQKHIFKRKSLAQFILFVNLNDFIS